MAFVGGLGDSPADVSHPQARVVLAGEPAQHLVRLHVELGQDAAHLGGRDAELGEVLDQQTVAPLAVEGRPLGSDRSHDPEALVMAVPQGRRDCLRSISPSRRFSPTDAARVPTRSSDMATSTAIRRFGTPCAASRTIRARWAYRWEATFARTCGSSSARSPSVTSNAGMLRMVIPLAKGWLVES